MPTIFRAMDTEWAVFSDRPDLHGEVERQVRELEGLASRFQPESALSRLNQRRALRSPELAPLVLLALQWRTATGGLFDPTLGAHLRAAGYRSSFEALPAEAERGPIPAGRLGVRVEGDELRLEGEGELDLGGIAKGWAVERAHAWLRAAGASFALVDGGGDLRGSGRPWAIGWGHDESLSLPDGAVATSSTERRRWGVRGGGGAHHILDPRSGEPARSALRTVTVRAPDTVTAEVLAKAVLIDPDTFIPRLVDFSAAATVSDAGGRWWHTPNWPEPA
jgi:thiamine biosynthesis lipoprotein